jgi:hypothetical protein
MTLLPVADGARLLGIHPKTLHLWLKQAHVPVVAHPTDARIGCVEWERIQQVASLHGRCLPSPAAARPLASAGPTPPLPPHEAPPLLSAETLPAASPPETGLLQQLSGLETRVAHLSDHLAHLALLLLQERDHTLERRLCALETLLAQLVDPSVILPPVPDPQPPLHKGEHTQALPRVRPLIPAEERARSRLPPLIEYSAPGVYVIVSAQEGELHLEPESPAWFEWLATISSFRFVGQQGRFTAYRDTKQGHPTRSWRAYRTIHQRNYRCSLGVTDVLTLVCLEQAAATLQAHMPSL